MVSTHLVSLNDHIHHNHILMQWTATTNVKNERGKNMPNTPTHHHQQKHLQYPWMHSILQRAPYSLWMKMFAFNLKLSAQLLFVSKSMWEKSGSMQSAANTRNTNDMIWIFNPLSWKLFRNIIASKCLLWNPREREKYHKNVWCWKSWTQSNGKKRTEKSTFYDQWINHSTRVALFESVCPIVHAAAVRDQLSRTNNRMWKKLQIDINTEHFFK